jgi:hypothetical protein
VVSTDEAALMRQRSYSTIRTGANLHLGQGIAVTSHASQANEGTILRLDVAREVGHACLLYGSKVALRDARHSTEQAAFLLGAPKAGSFLSLKSREKRHKRC